ncbi:T9SS type A sorting domain-containing protein [Aureispira]|nr:T9SS type A sorting domain-containing protein [Aureispira sp.]
MKDLILIILSLCLYQISEAQNFQFQMFFEDAIGNKDTLTIGYDLNGTELIDASFGEMNIIGIPLDSTFDVRISDAFFNNGNATFHTKKQILPDSCSGWRFPIVSIDIKSENWPVTATWNDSLFNIGCREGSVFTSFHPGGWWDVGGFPSDLGIAELANENYATFTSNYNPNSGYDENYAYINPSNDTIPVFWMAFGNSSLISLGVENISIEINSYPNPVKDFFYMDIQNHSVKNIRVVDMMGRSRIVHLKNGYIDMRDFNTGYYLIIIFGKDNKTQNLKIIKE